MAISESDINSGVRLSRLSGSFFKGGGDNADKTWLEEMGEGLVDKIKDVGKDIGSYLKSVAGGARVVFEKVTSGDWGFFKEWFDEAPLLPKVAGTGAAMLTGAVLIFAGGAVVGAAAGGIKGICASLGLANSVALASAMPAIMGTVINVGEWAYDFNWATPDTALINQCKEAINRIWEPMGEALGEAFAAIVVGRFGKAFAAPAVDVDLTVAAYFSLINPSLQDQIIDSLTDLLSAVKDIAYEILFLQTYKGVRQIAAKLTGNEQWGKEGQQPFVISEKVQTVYEEVKASDYLGHISDEQWEGIEAFGSTFVDTLKDLLQEEDTYTNWVKR